jgi:hypothetical protein
MNIPQFISACRDICYLAYHFLFDKELQEEIKAEMQQEEYEREHKIGAYAE